MNIMNYTRREASWMPHMASGERDSVLAAIVDRLCPNGFYDANPDLTRADILRALIDREKRQTTAVGSEIAFPHARLENLKKALFGVATFDRPVLFDGHPVRIICLILVPFSEPTISLKIMAQVSRLLNNEDVRQQVLAAKDVDTLRNIFKAYDPCIDKPILASDIMRLPKFSLRPGDPVVKCSHLMSVNHQHAVPVVDNQQRIIG